MRISKYGSEDYLHASRLLGMLVIIEPQPHLSKARFVIHLPPPKSPDYASLSPIIHRKLSSAHSRPSFRYRYHALTIWNTKNSLPLTNPVHELPIIRDYRLHAAGNASSLSQPLDPWYKSDIVLVNLEYLGQEPAGQEWGNI